uniref:NADH dehydrogenase subunit 6 n=1 Tax=Syrista parreyssii TaxID=1090889 RepID=A0A1W6Q5U2_9HYME|nr:NADH dehydrogenase subunit 6 [Syrista parreyssii]UGN61586.1 NADH dehydrogenase subunit 6 [Syrista parreyssii]
MLMNMMYSLTNTIDKFNYTIESYTIWMSLVMIFSLLNLNDAHPITMMMCLVIYSSIIAVKMTFLYKNSWYSYLLFLSMIGGILILFLYFVSVAPNEKFSFLKNEFMKLTLFMIISAILIYMIMYYNNDYFSMTTLFEKNNSFNLTNWSDHLDYNTTEMFNKNFKATIFMMIYLLYSLYTILKMCMSMYGPLRTNTK